ncbi:MAG: hypothetical protein ACRD04_11370 [Terriglobales bacterium]
MRLRVFAAIAGLAGAALLLGGCAHRAVSPAPPAPAAESAANAAYPPDPSAAKMPAAPGKVDVVNVCGSCHTLARVVREHQTREQWQATISQMQGNGLSAPAAELQTILSYLVKHYGPLPSSASGS